MPAGCDTTGIVSVTVSSSGADEPQAVVADRVVVLAARDEHDLVPVLRQPATDHSADRAGAVDHESHGRSLAHTRRCRPPGRVADRHGGRFAVVRRWRVT